MKRPTMLMKALLRQAGVDLDMSVERDVLSIVRRIEHEGFSFLAITLPTLSDALERGIENGTFTCPTAFSRQGRLPRLLGGFFKRVFDLDGRLYSAPDIESIYWIRQICRFFKKPKISCSPERELSAIESFVDIERQLRAATSHIMRKDLILEQVSAVLWSQVFPEIDYSSLVCRHGPGATAERLSQNERYRVQQWPDRSELTFPSDLHCYPNYGLAAEAAGILEGAASESGPDFLSVADEPPVRVVFVPKTLTGPRVIAIEPSHMQYMQQSVKDYVYKQLESHRLTNRSIRFSDQSVNQRLALSASKDRRLATLDLKDASDRVHFALVQRIFKTSGLLEYLEDARSLHALLPDGRNIILSKYASMGSALCFPVEAMVFYTIILRAMHDQDGKTPCSRSIREYSDLIDIYGDDIIVPVEYTDQVICDLESYSLKVNVNKSFKLSHFRESCGADYFDGVAVNPVYAREVPADDRCDWEAKTVMSWTETSNLFYIRGSWIIAQAIRDMLLQVVNRPIPRSRYAGSGVAFFSYIFSTDLRWNEPLQSWKQKRLHYIPLRKKDSIDGNETACLNAWGQRKNPTLIGESFGSRDSNGAISIPWIGHPGRLHDSGVLPKATCTESLFEYDILSALSGVPDSAWSSFDDICRMGLSRAEVHTGEPGNVNSIHFVPYCSTDEYFPDPLQHLSDEGVELDFTSSVKRGTFKSKYRWVSLRG